ncbi:MAG: response regulator transcription factor [Bacteroidetes bacterium]|nr:response regulator transcription factor [Bacteroidota bacterium]
MSTIRILVADNYPLSRNGIVHLLRRDYDKIIISEADTFHKIDKLLFDKKFNLLILSQSEVGKNHFSAIRRIKNSYPELPILVMCIYPENSYSYKVLKSGAMAYLSRSSGINEFKTAVKYLLAGKEYISSNTLLSLMEKTRKQKKLSIEQLSSRELQVLKLLAAGKSNKTIAQETKLVGTTISTYRLRILKKLGLKNNAQLIKIAIDYNLV